MIPVYQFHVAFSLKRYSFLSIGKVHQYIEETDQVQVDGLIKSFDKLIAGGSRIAVVLSGTFVEYLQQHPKTVATVKAGIKSDKLILLGSTYNESLASLYSPALFKEQIRTHQLLLKKVFDFTPGIFFNTAGLYFDKLSAVYEELGVTAAIAPISEWHLNGRESNSVFQGKNNVRLILFAESGTNQPNQIGQLNKDAVDMLTDSAVTEKYRVPQPIYNKGLVLGKTLSSNALQNAIHQKIIYLRKKLKKKQRIDLYNSLSVFTTLDFFNMLTKTDDQNNREPYEHYTHLMNALTDFEWVNKI